MGSLGEGPPPIAAHERTGFPSRMILRRRPIWNRAAERKPAMSPFGKALRTGMGMRHRRQTEGIGMRTGMGCADWVTTVESGRGLIGWGWPGIRQRSRSMRLTKRCCLSWHSKTWRTWGLMPWDRGGRCTLPSRSYGRASHEMQVNIAEWCSNAYKICLVIVLKSNIMLKVLLFVHWCVVYLLCTFVCL